MAETSLKALNSYLYFITSRNGMCKLIVFFIAIAKNY